MIRLISADVRHKTLWFTFILIIITILFSAAPVFSIPQYALIENARCINCHVTTQGAGIRNARGRIVTRDTGFIIPDGVRKIREQLSEKNTFPHDRITIGSDVRFQMARSHKSEDADRRFFPMQAAVYSTVEITERMFVEASYNFGLKKFFGQQKETISAILHPRNSFTQLRIGYFQPSIGIRYDDHTMLIRQITGSDGSSLIAPNFAEYGIEFNYNGIEWLTLTAGLFDAQSLSEISIRNSAGTVISHIDDKNTPTVLGRVEIRHPILEDTLPFNLGSSIFSNDNFYLLNVFSGIGIKDKLSVMTEYSRSKKSDLRTTNNFMIELTYRPMRPLLLFIRGERGKTLESFSSFDFDSYTNQGVLGAQIFVLPSIELRPEYRLVDTEQYRSTRLALQLHLFI